MSRWAIIRTMLATVLGLSVLLPAAPAAADNSCCQVGIASLPASFTAGQPPQFFVMTMANNSQQSIGGQIQATFGFQANGLNAGQVHLQRRTIGDNWRNVDMHNRNGSPEAVDTFVFFGAQVFGQGSKIDSQYRLSFGDKAPSTNVALTVTLTGRSDGHGGRDRQQLAQGGPYQTSVVGAGATVTPTPTPKPTPTPNQSLNTAEPTPTDLTGGPTDGGTAIGLVGSDSGSSDSGFTWLMYTIGALLLLGGIGVIGTMLWRRGPQPVDTDWTEQDDGYGSHAAPTAYGIPPHRMPAPHATSTTVYGTPTAVYELPQYGTSTQPIDPPDGSRYPTPPSYGPQTDPTTSWQ